MGQRNIRSAGDNHYKSNVYSLGVCLFFMTALDLPMFVTNLRDLQDNVDKRLKGISGYSEMWMRALRRMLTVEEGDRPDFLQLEDEIIRPLIPFNMVSVAYEDFTDDEPIPATPSPSSPPTDPIEVTLTPGSPYCHIHPKQSIDSIPCTLRLTGSALNTKRPGLDIICVLDLGQTDLELKVMKAGLEVVMQRLREGDRMAIFGYGKTAKKIAGLTHCSEEGKLKLRDRMDGIRLEQGADLMKGLVAAWQTLTQCRMHNSLTSIFLFSSCSCSNGLDTLKNSSEILHTINLDQHFTTHCFAPTSPHDFPLILSILKETAGTVHVAGTEAQMRHEVTQTLQRLDRVVATKVEVTLGKEVDTSLCQTKDFHLLSHALPLHLPYLLTSQSFHLSFLISLPPMTLLAPIKRSILTFSLQYHGPNNEHITIYRSLDLWLLPESSQITISDNSDVLNAGFYAETALCMYEMMDKVGNNHWDEAENTLSETLKTGNRLKKPVSDLNWGLNLVKKRKLEVEDWVKAINLANFYYFGDIYEEISDKNAIAEEKSLEKPDFSIISEPLVPENHIKNSQKAEISLPEVEFPPETVQKPSRNRRKRSVLVPYRLKKSAKREKKREYRQVA